MSNKTIDWQAIKKDYESGKAVPLLSEEYGVPKNTIYSRQHRGKWSRNLVEKVKARTQEVMAIVCDDTTVEQSQNMKEKDVDNAVEAKAISNVVVVMNHKKQIKLWQENLNRLAALVSTQLSSGEIVIPKMGEPVTCDVNAEYVSKTIASGTQALQRLLLLERQAHGLDVDQGGQEAVTFNIFDADNPSA